jgi:MFS family permease
VNTPSHAVPRPDDAPAPRGVVLVLTLTTLIQALASMAALSIPVIGASITADFGLSTAAIGYYISLLYFAAALASLVGGEAAQRWGPVRVSQLCLLLCAAGLALVATGQLGMAMAGALLIGVGYGPVTPASSQWLAMSTPARHRSLIFSIKQTGVPLGGAAAGLAVPVMSTAHGWSWALAAVAVACLVCALAAQPMRETFDHARDGRHPVNLRGLGQLWQMIVATPSLRTLAVASFWLSTFQLSLSAYLTTYLHEAFGYSLVSAGATMSAAQIAGVSGRIVWGAMADRWLGSVRMLMVLAGGMALGGALMALLTDTGPQWLPAVTVVVVSAFSLGWNGTFLAEVARQAPPGTAGRATGAILACTFAGVVIGPPVFGSIAAMTDSYRIAFGVALLGPALAGTLLVLRRRAFTDA